MELTANSLGFPCARTKHRCILGISWANSVAERHIHISKSQIRQTRDNCQNAFKPSSWAASSTPPAELPDRKETPGCPQQTAFMVLLDAAGRSPSLHPLRTPTPRPPPFTGVFLQTQHLCAGRAAAVSMETAAHKQTRVGAASTNHITQDPGYRCLWQQDDLCDPFPSGVSSPALPSGSIHSGPQDKVKGKEPHGGDEHQEQSTPSSFTPKPLRPTLRLPQSRDRSGAGLPEARLERRQQARARGLTGLKASLSASSA